MKRLILLAGCAAALAACSPQKAAAPKTAEASAPKYNVDMPMKEVMGDIIDPASWIYWRASGTEVTAKGEKDLAPTTEDGWIAVENAAGVLVEAGNLLQLPGRARAPEADWNRYAQQLTERALAAREAALKKDKKAVFDEGGKVYEVCTACHEQFVIQPELKAEGGAPSATLPALPKDLQDKATSATK